MKKRGVLLSLVISALVILFTTIQVSAQDKEGKGFLQVHTNPSGLEIYVDGKIVGKSPIENLSLDIGDHLVSVKTDPCFAKTLFYTWNRNVSISDSRTTFLEINPEPLMQEISASGLKVGDEVLEGNTIYVDGEKVGTVPGKITVPVCSKILEITKEDEETVILKADLKLLEGKIIKTAEHGYKLAYNKKEQPGKNSPNISKAFKPVKERSVKKEFGKLKKKQEAEKKFKKVTPGPYKWVGASFIIGGVLLAGTGGLFDYLAWKKFKDYSRMGTEEEIREQLAGGDMSKAEYLIKRDDIYEKGKDLILARNIFFVAGSVCALTGVILIFVKPSSKERTVSTSFRIIPGPESFFISTDISF